MYVVAKVLKPQGMNGEIKTEIITSFPEHLKKLDVLFIETEQSWQSCSIETVRISGRIAYFKLAQIDSYETAAQLKGRFLYVSKKNLAKLRDDEYFMHDLIGMKVYDEQDLCRGEIIQVESYPANDVYVVRDSAGELHDIPAVKEFILDVDVAQKVMRIHAVEGLLD
jgi:16S rRNA processing protein RimM